MIDTKTIVFMLVAPIVFGVLFPTVIYKYIEFKKNCEEQMERCEIETNEKSNLVPYFVLKDKYREKREE